MKLFKNPELLLTTLLVIFLFKSFLLKRLLETPKQLSRLFTFIKKRLRPSSPKKKECIYVAGERISDEERLRHTHIVGATGSGKSVLLEKLIMRDIARGLGAIIVDPKGDRSLYLRLKRFCQEIGRGEDFKLLSATHPHESNRWNPCRIGSFSELQSKFYNSGVYHEPYYAKACEFALLASLKELTTKNDAFTLLDLIQKLEVYSKNEKEKDIRGLFLDLKNLAMGEWSEILCCAPKTTTREEISLADVVRKNEILFVDLPTESRSVQSGRFGKILLQEVILISGFRKTVTGPDALKPFPVYIDEFDAFATDSFATFLNKGRSSNFMIHLAHQTLADLNRVSVEFAAQILGNSNVRFVFRQDDPDDAERWSRFFGTHAKVSKTWKTSNGWETGDESNRWVQQFRISPDTIKSLPIGNCVYSIKTRNLVTQLEIPFNEYIQLPKKPVDRGSPQSSYLPRPQAHLLSEPTIDTVFKNLIKPKQEP